MRSRKSSCRGCGVRLSGRRRQPSYCGTCAADEAEWQRRAATQPRSGADTALLDDPKHVRADARLIARAVRERWPVADGKRPVIVERLFEVAMCDAIAVETPNGVFMDVRRADANAIAAANVLVAMEAQNQADEHLATG